VVWRSIDESARRLGHYCWVEQRLFEIIGGWVPTVAEPEAQLLLRSHSFRHGWYARVWEERLPRTSRLEPGRVIGPARSGVVGILEALSALETTPDRLGGVYEVVVPEMLAAYEEEASGAPDHTGAASGPADPGGATAAPASPLDRWVRVVGRELRTELSEGRELIGLLFGAARPTAGLKLVLGPEGGLGA